MAKILRAKYHSNSFDYSLDISQQEQISEIVCYVDTNNGKYMVEENILAFLKPDENTGSGFTDEIVNKLSPDCQIISDCRGQLHGNMTDKYQGQAQILQLNDHARFSPFSVH